MESVTTNAETTIAVRCCPLCLKPYPGDSSYHRHVQYCRRTQSRPRLRSKSCRNCSAAKVKCTSESESQCLRCKKKGVSCVYPGGGSGVDAARPRPNLRTHTHTHTHPTPSPSTNSLSPIPDSSAIPSIEADWNTFFPAHSRTTVDHGANDEGATEPRASKTSIDDTMGLVWTGHSNNGGLNQGTANIWPPNGQVAIVAPATLVMSERPDLDFLARIPRNDPILHFTSSLVVQTLRAFPRMMIRRETFPSFIHAHWCNAFARGGVSLPEPLVNCMGIAQMFVSRNVESSPFLWRTVKNEQRLFIQNQDERRYTRPELLAAIQAQIMYIIMRALDDTYPDPELNQEMVVTHQVLCESFTRMGNDSFCLDERQYSSSTWEGWIFAESRRRTVFVWLLIAQSFRIKTGVPCAIINGYRSLPLTSPKGPWEARTRATWQTEYDIYKAMPRTGMDTLGDLVDACRERKVAHWDEWNATADSFSMLLRLGAEMM